FISPSFNQGPDSNLRWRKNSVAGQSLDKHQQDWISTTRLILRGFRPLQLIRVTRPKVQVKRMLNLFVTEMFEIA
ncbi:hypothetical protein, partial [Mesorhizobium sp. L2C084A000]|uniref:hypothetical protein n=1 Tax=Mesorhizobium sp. L2C084A000 TaxID=1287116 RepID=UPI000517E80A